MAMSARACARVCGAIASGRVAGTAEISRSLSSLAVAGASRGSRVAIGALSSYASPSGAVGWPARAGVRASMRASPRARSFSASSVAAAFAWPDAVVAATKDLSTVTVELYPDGVALLTLNRPKALNALNKALLDDVLAACEALDVPGGARAIVLTGSGDKAFAAGADIKEMAQDTLASARARGLLSGWERLSSIRTPLIAAVNGYALGGGCELAMLCDVAIASERAQFGQPEITLGIVPGMGGTQRLVRAVGKSRAMEMVLTGDRMKADEALRRGLVARVVPHDETVSAALEIGSKIAAHSAPAVRVAKQAVNAAFETTLKTGLEYEKNAFWSCFALDDQKEGMAAFAEKRKAVWKDQ